MPSSPEVRERRARRRQRTLDIARRRRDEHLRLTHFDDTTGLAEVDCVCELSNTYFAKRTAQGCGCSKRRKGAPKVASGMCDIGARDRIYEWRRERRKLRTEARTGRWDGEEPVRARPKADNKPPRTFVLEKQDYDRKGNGYGWFPYRKYRTLAGLRSAERQLNLNCSWRRSEFRAAA